MLITAGTGVVKVLAEVLYAGHGCPVCGGKKTEAAKTCIMCRVKIGPKATAAINQIMAAIQLAKEGHKKAIQGNVPRNILFGPILAQVRINKDARLHAPTPELKIPEYIKMGKNIPGGFLNFSVFGADISDAAGKVITGIIEVKNKEVGDNEIPYVRVQKVPDGVISNVRLAIQEAGSYIENLPHQKFLVTITHEEEGKDRIMEFSVGFVPARNP